MLRLIKHSTTKKKSLVKEHTPSIVLSFIPKEFTITFNGDWLDSLHLMKAVKATRHGEWSYFDSSGNIETTKKYYFGKILKWLRALFNKTN